MRALIGGLVAALVLSTLPASARAATFVVNSTDDGAPGSCDAVTGGCTLREAIIAAVATPGRDTIRFDPGVFFLGSPALIGVQSALPVIADAAGTVIDGAGAGVIINFSPPIIGGNPVDGLVFTSASGVALTKSTVANVTVQLFTGSGIVFCGGTLPGCDDDLSTVLVQNVVATQNGAFGIKFDGRADTKIRIVDSVVSFNTDGGISGNGAQSVTGVRIERCTAHGNGFSGFSVNAAVETVGTVITDSIAVQNEGDGIDVNAGERTTKTTITNIVARGNDLPGVSVTAGSQVTGLAIANVLATGNASTGVDIASSDLVTAALKDVVANNNTGSG